jgi:pimeloyl-ACP methyl ester carboxylesterase
MTKKRKLPLRRRRANPDPRSDRRPARVDGTETIAKRLTSRLEAPGVFVVGTARKNAPGPKPKSGETLVKLHFRSYGRGHPLIVLHGLLGAGGNWHSLADNVFSRAYRTLAVDLRNHGRSPHADEFSYESMARDVLELMDRLEMESAHLLGHSMGGKTAMHFALEHSERVDGLVVADIAPVDYEHRHEDTLAALERLDLGRFRSRTDIENALATDFPDASMRQFILKGVVKRGPRFDWRFNLRSIIDGYPSLQEAVLGWQPHEGPTLFIRGGRSDYIREEHLLQIRTLFPYAEVATIDEAGHWVHADAPERFGETVMSFLAGV